MRLEEIVEYREIIGYPGYRIGDNGTIWSWRCKGGTKIWRWKQLKGWTIKGGYTMIRLISPTGKRICRTIHRIVLLSFVGPCPEGMEACHNNNIPNDNRLVNLRWDTPKNNCVDRKEHGLHSANTGRGSTHGMHKLTEDQVLLIRNSNMNADTLAVKYKVNVRTIYDILARKSWRHI